MPPAHRLVVLFALGAAACATSDPVAGARAPGSVARAAPEAGPAPVRSATPPETTTPSLPAALPFDPSPDDRAELGTGLSGTRVLSAAAGPGLGVVVAGVREDGPLGRAGVVDGDVIVELAGRRFDGERSELLEQFKTRVAELTPDTRTTVVYARGDAAPVRVEVQLGRRPPSFARESTPDDWFEADAADVDADIVAWTAAAVALDDGAARLADTWARQRRRFTPRDTFRLRETVVAQFHPEAQEALAARLLARVAADPSEAARIAAGEGAAAPATHAALSSDASPEAWLDALEAFLVPRAGRLRDELADWTPEERAYVAAHVDGLTQRTLVDGEYVDGDTDVARERANRRLVALLARVRREVIADVAREVLAFLDAAEHPLAAAVRRSGKEGLVAARDTAAGRIELWGAARQRHTRRCLFRFDVGGDDEYLDVAGRADPEQPLAIDVDVAGDDTYGATSPFALGGALCGVGILRDLGGDDRYTARQWSEGAALAGFGLLDDRAGDDTYRGNEACQGTALVGGGVLRDTDGRDVYEAQRFSQGVGLPAGVGVLVDVAGDDRYACTGRYGSEYGEDGLFSGWGQGVGFGFRNLASGGIGLLHDAAGDDVYEAGNFSQGGGYFFAWGVARDDAGRDLHAGSRYAQGFAAHEAAGTFLEGAGDDVYRSHSNVAQGLSWDETSVLFRDRGGDDDYRTSGFSLASAAHNGVVVFVDDAGDDTYADLPAHASSNDYHGGRSFALFVDRAGSDRYGARAQDEWNGRAWWRDEGAYLLDLDGARPVTELVRPAESAR